jgi:hypothetical protein
MFGVRAVESLPAMLDSTASRLAAFAAGLAIVGGAAAGVGAATEVTPPLQDCLKIAAAGAGFAEDEMAAEEGHDGEPMIEAVPGADGLRSALAGVTLAPIPRAFTAGASATWRFRVTDCTGGAVTGLEPENGKLLHLIVVRTDLTGYQHLHPRRHRDGTWSVDLRTPRAGSYRAIADFVIDGRKYVVGTTLRVPGAARDAALPAPSLRARADGYDVELQRPAELLADEEAQLTFRVTRNGRPERDLEPYLGAYGHLVALHAPDLAYSHVHPNGEDRDGGAISFDTELHERGRYRLFLQFQTGGRVHTVAFTQSVS